jgi:hypothetical protein
MGAVMVLNNNAQEIIAECRNSKDPAGFLEIYIWFLCQQLELKDERIYWLKQQLEKA